MADLFAGALPIPLEAQIRELDRELALRRRVYPSWVVSGRLTASAAERQMASLQAARDTLAGLHCGASDKGAVTGDA